MPRSRYKAKIHCLFPNSYKNLRLKQLHDTRNIMVIFPKESDEQSTIVLVYDPMTSSASPLLDEKKKCLDDIEKEILKMAKDAADVKSEIIAVDKRWHDAVVGHGGTTLNA
jgi:tetrahydromethanopterin S-methyltransferase subunit H